MRNSGPVDSRGRERGQRWCHRSDRGPHSNCKRQVKTAETDIRHGHVHQRVNRLGQRLTWRLTCDIFPCVPAVGEAHVSSRQIRSRGPTQFTNVTPQCGEGERKRRATHLFSAGLRNRLSHRSETLRPAQTSGPFRLVVAGQGGVHDLAPRAPRMEAEHARVVVPNDSPDAQAAARPGT
jgi:hypothetical protein